MHYFKYKHRGIFIQILLSAMTTYLVGGCGLAVFSQWVIVDVHMDSVTLVIGLHHVPQVWCPTGLTKPLRERWAIL